jgi:Flp pilus assembly protein TadB
VQNAPTARHAPDRRGRETTDADHPTLGEMLGDVINLSAGLGVMLLPLLVTALPGVVLFVLAPAFLLLVLAAIPVAIAGALIAPAYLLVRSVRRHALR